MWDSRLCRSAMMCGPRPSFPMPPAWFLQSPPDGPTGVSWLLRQRNFDAAAQRFDQALKLDNNDDRIYYLQGLLESDRGNSGQAITDLREAVKRNPRNLRAIYLLASEVERQGAAQSEAEFQHLMQQLLASDPNNLAALLDLCRISAKQSDAATLRNAISRVDAQSASWPDGSEATAGSLEDRGQRTRRPRCCDAIDLFAQRADARARIPRQPA